VSDADRALLRTSSDEHPPPSAASIERRMGFRDGDIDSLGPRALSRQPLERAIVGTPPSEAAALRILSGVQCLCGYSRLHASYPPQMLDRRIVPSLTLGQFHYYTDPRGVPLAFCNWAWLNPQILGETLATGRDLHPDEFKCGDLPFFYELLAPFGHCRAVVRELRGLPFFRGRRIPAIRGEMRDCEPLGLRVQHFQF
jgi:cytolysin-activating lysine-acyltransferase